MCTVDIRFSAVWLCHRFKGCGYCSIYFFFLSLDYKRLAFVVHHSCSITIFRCCSSNAFLSLLMLLLVLMSIYSPLALRRNVYLNNRAEQSWWRVRRCLVWVPFFFHLLSPTFFFCRQSLTILFEHFIISSTCTWKYNTLTWIYFKFSIANSYSAFSIAIYVRSEHFQQLFHIDIYKRLRF